MSTVGADSPLSGNHSNFDADNALLLSEHLPPGSDGDVSDQSHRPSFPPSTLRQRIFQWFRPSTWQLSGHDRPKTRDAFTVEQNRAADQHPRRDEASWMTACSAVLLSSWTNVLLVFVPAGIATGLCKVPPIVIFVCNAIAIVPLSSLLAFATECIANDLGDTVGALMNISFGNLIEVIMFVIALVHNEIHVVQGALVGSILVNLLLILGTAIIAGEFQPLEMVYDMNNAQALACLLSLSVFSILIPAALQFTFDDENTREQAVLTLSRASAITLLVVYGIYLRFLLRPRKRQVVLGDTEFLSDRMRGFNNPLSDNMSISRLSRTIRFADEHVSDQGSIKSDSVDHAAVEMDMISEQDDERASISSDDEPPDIEASRSRLMPIKSHTQPPSYRRSTSYSRSRSSSLTGIRRLRHADVAERYGASLSDLSDSNLLPRTMLRTSIGSGPDEVASELQPAISRITALFLLVGSSLLVALCADFLVQTIAVITATSTLSESFIGLIILPIVGNAAEYITAVTVAAKGKVDLAIGVSFGSSIQIALFVNPLMVILGWAMRRNMSLYFGLFETATLIGVALLVNFLIWNGRTNYLEGSLLCACYVMIGVGAFLIP